MVEPEVLLENLGIQFNHRIRRGPCPVHEGSNPTAFTYKGRRFHCFSCGWHGDGIDLVQEVRGIGFREALKFLADMAGVEIDDSLEARQEFAKQRAERRKVEEAARRLRAIERQVRGQYKNEIHDLEAIKERYGKRLGELNGGASERSVGEEGFLWTALEFVSKCLPRALAGYTITSFANTSDRARFALHAEAREPMIDAALLAGHVVADDEKVMEVLT